MITKKISKCGNHYVVEIEKEIIDFLGITEDTSLELSTPDGMSLVLTPTDIKPNKKNVSKALKEINKKYGSVLKRLAE